MKEAPTLIDALYRRTFHPDYRRYIDPPAKARGVLQSARKFTLDSEMSAFMADLAYATIMEKETHAERHVVMEHMRHLARLPHAVTWIEYDMRARAERAEKEYNARLIPGESPERCGWLLMQHPEVETAFISISAASHGVVHPTGEMVPDPSMHWLAVCWSSEDHPLPWQSFDLENAAVLSQMLTGIYGYHTPYLTATYNPLWPQKVSYEMLKLTGDRWLTEYASDIRYLWALLATINDLPTIVTDVRASKGFVARGSYRRFLDHSIIHLKIPQPRFRKVASEAIEHIRRRAHQVRGHWRRDWRHEGQRIWIREHQRGDASLGFVTHDYSVEKGHPDDHR